MCNVCNSCNVCNASNGATSFNNSLCGGLWNLLFNNCLTTANDNGNSCSNGCYNRCGSGCFNPCNNSCANRRSNRCSNCCMNRCPCCGYVQTYSTSSASSFNGDLYYAYQYGLLPRSGGVCGTNSCCNSCNAY